MTTLLTRGLSKQSAMGLHESYNLWQRLSLILGISLVVSSIAFSGSIARMATEPATIQTTQGIFEPWVLPAENPFPWYDPPGPVRYYSGCTYYNAWLNRLDQPMQRPNRYAVAAALEQGRTQTNQYQTRLGVLAANGPAGLTSGIKAERNIPYVENGHPNQVLDIYLPEKPASEQLPVFIWIHGGAWMAGSQANPPVLALVKKGFAVASIQYRFSLHAIWPAQAFDCKAAIRFLRANAAKYNLNPDQFAVGGDSAGGHLAAFIGTSGGVSDMEGDLGNCSISSRVQAVVDLFGPTDLTLMAQQSGPESIIQHDSPNSPESLLLGGPVQQRRELAKTANPLTYIDKNDPPFLIMHGDRDTLVPLAQSTILAKALIDAGVSEVIMKTIHGAGHGGPQFYSQENMQLIEEFLVRHLKVGRK